MNEERREAGIKSFDNDDRDTELDLIVVRQYDTDDILNTVQYFVLVREEGEESSDGSFIVSSIAEPAEPAVVDQNT